MAKTKKTIAEQTEIEPKPETAMAEEQNPSIQEENQKLIRENDTLKAENSQLREYIDAREHPVYPIVIPYKKSEAQGQELRLAITGWLKHFKERFKIIVIGDWEDFLTEITEDIIHIPHECSAEDPALDVVSKLLTVISEMPEYEGLILTNDDIYPVNDFDITDVRFLKTDGFLTDQKSTGTLYARNRKKTLDLLIKEEKTIFDYGCHTPVYLEASKLIDLVDRFDLQNEAYLLSSLYFNFFFPARIPMKLDIFQDNLKVGVYRKNADLKKLQELIPWKIWVNNSEEGWSPEFAALLESIL